MVVSNVDIFQGTVSGVTHFKFCDNIIMCTSFQFVNPCYLLDEFQGIISRIDKIVFSNENCTFDQFICVTYSGHQSSKSSLKSCFTSFSFASFFFFYRKCGYLSIWAVVFFSIMILFLLNFILFLSLFILLIFCKYFILPCVSFVFFLNECSIN